MQIIKIAKKGNYYHVYLENDQELKLLEATIIDFALLKPKIELTEEKLEAIIAKNNYYLCLERGISYLSSLHSRKEVYLYLNKKFEKSICLEVIKKLIDLKLLNDQEYAIYYLDYCFKNNKGPYLCRLGMQNEDLPMDVIEAVLPNYTLEMEYVASARALEKQVLNYKKETKKSANLKAKVFLKNRGFSEKAILYALAKNADLLDNIVDESTLIQNEYEKLFRKHSKNYADKELDRKIKEGLYRKGFSLEQINYFLEMRGKND